MVVLERLHYSWTALNHWSTNHLSSQTTTNYSIKIINSVPHLTLTCDSLRTYLLSVLCQTDLSSPASWCIQWAPAVEVPCRPQPRPCLWEPGSAVFCSSTSTRTQMAPTAEQVQNLNLEPRPFSKRFYPKVLRVLRAHTGQASLVSVQQWNDILSQLGHI